MGMGSSLNRSARGWLGRGNTFATRYVFFSIPNKIKKGAFAASPRNFVRTTSYGACEYSPVDSSAGGGGREGWYLYTRMVVIPSVPSKLLSST